jgi:hypothetical protein
LGFNPENYLHNILSAGKIIKFSFDIGNFLLREEEVREEIRGQFKLQETE